MLVLVLLKNTGARVSVSVGVITRARVSVSDGVITEARLNVSVGVRVDVNVIVWNFASSVGLVSFSVKLNVSVKDT